MGKRKKVLVKPDVRTVFLKNEVNEKVTYLSIPADFYEYSLQEDIKNGAEQYREIAEVIVKPRLSRVIVLTPESLEMGLMAVSYLSMHLQEVRSGGEELPFDIELPENVSFWYESSMRIPILSLSEMVSYSRRNETPFDNGGFLENQAKAKRNRDPYWRSCNSEAVCIIVNRDSVETEDMSMIDLFRRNRNVFVIFLEDEETHDEVMELPFSTMDKTRFRALRNHFILSHIADAVSVTFEDKCSKLYYKHILRQNLKQKGIRVKKGFSYERIVNLASSINPKAVCEMIDKIVNYALKDILEMENIVLKNEDFAFVDRFSGEAFGGRQKKNGQQMLEKNLVGMEDIKQQVYDVVNVMKYNQMRKKMNISGSSYHNVHVMLGAPGTAKTTVAKYMGQMMFDEKLLPDSRFICVNGAELKGMYVGHSAPKTKALFEKYDVIIIDEAYSIVETGGRTDSFGNEAIAQLIVELERHSTDKLIIFAGYGGENMEKGTNKMQDFLESNPGIRSRITSTFYFKSYTAEDMMKIFQRIAELAHYEVEAGCLEIVKEFFAKRVSERDFGNGREARALLENTTLFAARRLMEGGKKLFSEEEMKLLTVEDVRNAAEKMQKNFKSGKSTKIGFIY